MMNGYEQMFFGQSQQGIAPLPQSTRGAQERQGPFDFQNFRNQMAGPNTAMVVMPMNYEGAGTLKNDSIFVSVTNNKDFLPSLRQSHQVSIPMRATQIRNSVTDLRNSGINHHTLSVQPAATHDDEQSSQYEPPLHSVSIRQSINANRIDEIKEVMVPKPFAFSLENTSDNMFERDDDLNLNDLEKAINEISELNVGMVPTAKPILIELPDGTILKSQKSDQEVIRLPS